MYAVNKDKKLSLYVTGGYPDIKTFQYILKILSKNNADIIEIGIPFSDPIADGEVIQKSTLAALENKITIIDIVNAIKEIKSEIKSELYFMTYYNLVFVYGEDKFIKLCKQADIKGVIIPDLPYDEGKLFYKKLIKNNIKTTLLITSVTTEERIKNIAKLTTGFIYFVSVLGTTGARNILPIGIKDILRKIKNSINKEVFLGFGIKSPETVKPFIKYIDGMIVGSALLELISNNLKNKKVLGEKLTAFVKKFKNIN